MTLSCAEVTDSYVKSLSGNFRCVPLGRRLRIVTPYLYPDNDLIEVFVEEPGRGRIRVTDLGETLRHLHSQGFEVSGTPKRKRMAETIATGVGVDVIRGELAKEGTVDEIGDLLFDVIVAARGVADLIYTSRTYEPPTFVQEVGRFLQERQVEYEPEVKLTGESGKIYTVDFRLMPANKYLHTLSPRQVAALQPVVNRVFRIWVDCNGRLGRDAKVSLLNDIDYEWKQPEVALLGRVSIVGYWSRREELLPTLMG
ncbi:MAG: DUF1828 domain-containing protein [Bacillota bacterium]|nr:DUF1828 domain-containing protein [Bacillota bacterium]